MEYSVKLAHLPENVIFPDRLQSRVNFDAAKGQFSYQGFMTKCTYDELSVLSDDPNYHRALEQLFVKTSEEIAPPPARSTIPAAIALATLGAVALAFLVVWSLTRQVATDKAVSPGLHNTVSAASR